MVDPRCNACAACCDHAVVPPFTPEEIRLVPEELAAPILAVWSHAADPTVNFWSQTGTRVCSWLDLDTRLCRHYDIRPGECSRFEVGGADCIDLRTRAGLTEKTVPLTIEGN